MFGVHVETINWRGQLETTLEALSDDCGDVIEPHPLVFLDNPILLPSSILSD